MLVEQHYSSREFDHEESVLLPLDDFSSPIREAFKREFEYELLKFRVAYFDNRMPLPLTESSRRVLHLASINGDNWEKSLIEIAICGRTLMQNPDIAGSNTQEYGVMFPFLDARQDARTLKSIPDSTEKAISKGQGVTTDIFASIIGQTGKASYVVTLDIHSHKAIKTFGENGLDVINLHPLRLFVKEMEKEGLLDDRYETTIGTTDFGSLPRAIALQQYIDAPVVIIGKNRISTGEDGTKSDVTQEMLYGNVEGKRVILWDDICASAGTLRKAVQLAIENGAKELVVCFTHGVFVNNYYEELETILRYPQVKLLMTTNSLPFKDRRMGEQGVPYVFVDQEENGRKTKIKKQMKVMDIGPDLAQSARVILESPTLEEAKLRLAPNILHLCDPRELANERYGIIIPEPTVGGVYKEGGQIFPLPVQDPEEQSPDSRLHLAAL